MQPTFEPEAYLSTQELGGLLRRSLTTIYRLTQRKDDPLPARRLGGTLLFIAAEVHQWVDRQTNVKTKK